MALNLFDVPLEAVTLSDVTELLESGQLELKQLEYKRELPPTQSELKELRKAGQFRDEDPIPEFAADVSAMANSDGGDIIFGIDGKTLELAPIAIEDWDSTRLRLEQLILSNIEPQLSGFDFRPLKAGDHGYIVILRVPRSLVGPHQITAGRKKFFMRHPGGKHPMDIAQIRAAFLSSAQAIEQARKWRNSRFSMLTANQGQLQFERGPIQSLHLIPLRFLDPTSVLDVRTLAKQEDLLARASGYNLATLRYNADGVLSFYRTAQHQSPDSYVQFFRGGQIELVRALPGNPFKQELLPSGTIENDLLEALACSVTAMQRAGIALPILIGLAYINVAGCRLAAGNYHNFPQEVENFTITPNIIPYRDLLMTEWTRPTDMPSFFRDLVESLWNASGFPSSLNYDDQGSHPMSQKLSKLPLLRAPLHDD